MASPPGENSSTSQPAGPVEPAEPTRLGHHGPAVKLIAATVGILATAALPFVMVYGFTRWGVRPVALLVALVAFVRVAIKLLTTARERLTKVLPVPLTLVALAGLSWAIDDPRFVLATPALINLILLTIFSTSLFKTETMIERFALLEVTDLSPQERAHCRATTVAWCCLFAVNTVVSTALMLQASLDAWAVFTGPVSYGLIAGLFTVEFIVRSAKFRRHGEGPLGRLMSRVFPPRG